VPPISRFHTVRMRRRSHGLFETNIDVLYCQIAGHQKTRLITRESHSRISLNRGAKVGSSPKPVTASDTQEPAVVPATEPSCFADAHSHPLAPADVLGESANHRAEPRTADPASHLEKHVWEHEHHAHAHADGHVPTRHHRQSSDIRGLQGKHARSGTSKPMCAAVGPDPCSSSALQIENNAHEWLKAP
jgi:hypothetical protein